MRTTLIAVTTGLAAAGLAVTTVLTGTATAGHSNALLQATLDGRDEVRTAAADNRIAGDPDGKGEAYVFGIDGDPTTLCYVLTVAGIDELALPPGSPTNRSSRAAHIHKGQPGQNGPVVANLAWPQGGDAADCLTDGEAGKFVGGVTVQDILGHPDEYYVNVHNDAFPGGALRGQLAAQD